ncbi:MAG: hypothetical protein J3K34DRAFT_461669 [Monoraphidium minutum]|nr:MAG: hypothetical protein J3K34DRAFT_461669 [Monoraphidium minutum]
MHLRPHGRPRCGAQQRGDPGCSTPGAALLPRPAPRRTAAARAARPGGAARALRRPRCGARPEGSGSSGSSGSSGRGAADEAQRVQEHEALLAHLLALPGPQLPAFVEAERERLTYGFMAFLAERARGGPRRGGAGGWGGGGLSGGGGGAGGSVSAQERARLSELAAQLVTLKEAADWEAAQRSLPPLASSLAYSNYASWRGDNGGVAAPDVAPGVSVEDLYRAGERAELQLRSGGGLRPREAAPLDDFARRGPGAVYSAQAAAAMERVRARLMGYEDDGPGAAGGGEGSDEGSSSASEASGGASEAGGGPAAERVLRALLLECSCRGERAQAVAEACVPPGLEVAADAPGGRPVSVCTSPPRLLAAIALAQQLLEGASGGGGPAAALPSGEGAAVVLSELAEDVAQYEAAVYRRLSPLERYGAGPGALR